MKRLIVFVLATISFGLVAAQPENLAQYLSSRVRGADKAEIEFYIDRGTRKVNSSDAQWVERMAKMLETAKFEPMPHCMCISFPRIELFSKGKSIGSFSVHHGHKLRVYAGEVQGDFEVGPDLGAAVTALANEVRPDAGPMPAPAAVKAPTWQEGAKE